LWYIVGSLSHAGFLTVASASLLKNGVSGKLTSGSSAGKPLRPAKSRSSNARPAASR
jgi:hypothetical protein